MAGDSSKKFTDKDKDRLFQEFRKWETGQGAEVTEAPNRINKILERYGSSLEQVANNPEWLLGSTGKENSQEYQDLYDKFQDVMRANQEFAGADEAKSQEIEYLRSKKTLYVFNPWNNHFVKQLREKNTNLIKSEAKAVQTAEQATQTVEQATQKRDQVLEENKGLVEESKQVKAESEEVRKLNDELQARISVYEQTYSLNMSEKFTSTASPNATIVSKVKSNTPIFDLCNHGITKIAEKTSKQKIKKGQLPDHDYHMESTIGKVREACKDDSADFIPGSLNQFDQTELMHICFLVNCKSDEKQKDGWTETVRDNADIGEVIDRFLGDGNGIPDIKTRDKFGFSEPELVARVAPPSKVKAYLERVSKPVDIKLEHMLAYHTGNDLYEMAQIYQKYSTDSNKKIRAGNSTDDLCRILRHKSIEDRMTVMNIYEQLSRPVKNKVYEGNSVVSIMMNWSNGRDKERTEGHRDILFGILRKFHELGGEPTEKNDHINSTSELHESAEVILHGGINALGYYVREMGGELTPSVTLKGMNGSLCDHLYPYDRASDYESDYVLNRNMKRTYHEFDMLSKEDKKTYNKLLAEQTINRSQVLHNEEDSDIKLLAAEVS